MNGNFQFSKQTENEKSLEVHAAEERMTRDESFTLFAPDTTKRVPPVQSIRQSAARGRACRPATAAAWWNCTLHIAHCTLTSALRTPHSALRIASAFVAAALVCAGCAGSGTVAEAEPVAAAAVPEKPKTFVEASKDVNKDLRNYSVHTYASDVHKKLAPALKFLEDNAHEAVSNKNAYVEVQKNFVQTAARSGDYEIAKEVADVLMKTEGIYKGFCLDGAEYLAKGLMKKGDFKGAEAIYAPFANNEVKNMDQGNLVRAIALRSSVYTGQNDMNGALGVIAEARAKKPGNDGYNEGYWQKLDEEAVKVYGTFYCYEDAYAYCLKNGRKSSALRLITDGHIPDVPRGVKLANEILSDKNQWLGARADAWSWLFDKDHAVTDKYLYEMLGTTTRETNSIIDKLSAKLCQYQVHNVYSALTPAYFSDNQESIRVWETYLKLLKLVNRVPDFKMAQYAFVAYAGNGDLKGAVSAAKEGLANEKIKPEERYELELAAKTLLLGGSADAIAKSIAGIEPAVAGDLAAKERIKGLDRVASAALISRNENLARGFAAYRGQVKPVLPKKEYTARFSKRPIAGAGDWENLPFKPEEQAFERKYGGGDMSFMTTDVATGDRGNAVKGGDKSAHPTTLQAAVDDWGIHVLLKFYDSRAREFEAGVLDAGSYECYIAPGDNQPYSCFLGRPKKDALASIYSTSYDSPGHRRIDDKNPTKFRSDVFFTDDCIMNYFAFSWDNFATLIPAKDSKWDFECIFWGPVPSAWNGTESIHGRSTWGTLKFDISDADRVKIYRSQIFKAVNLYNAEKKPLPPSNKSVQGGVFDYWNDESLGDPEFYEKVLKPLEEKLDVGAARAKVGMPDSEVIDLAENYLQQWRDVRFTVARLRAEYMKLKLTE